MNKKQLEAITGTLSKPGKMPGFSYGIPAKECKTGSKLAKIKGSVCYNCYALKGMYRFETLKWNLNTRSITLSSRRSMTPGSSSKLQATSLKLQALKLQAASLKPQAASLKLQAASDKLPDS